KKATNNLDGKEQVSATIKENVQNWLDKTFLPKYIDSSDITDVQYIMKNPALLGGSQKYKDINEVDVYKDGNYLIAKVTVDVEDAKTQIDSTQEMTLELRKDGGNKFYVENLKHTLGK
ncbi:conjugal transfer protein, partial [Lactiplantibacillus plajomi]